MELVDMLDSKSGDFTVVWVRVPSLVKIGINSNCIIKIKELEKSDFFYFSSLQRLNKKSHYTNVMRLFNIFTN